MEGIATERKEKVHPCNKNYLINKQITVYSISKKTNINPIYFIKKNRYISSEKIKAQP